MEKSIFSKRKNIYLKNTKNINHFFPQIEKSNQKYFLNTRNEITKRHFESKREKIF